MDITADVIQSINSKGQMPRAEFKAVLPPSRNIAQMISAFANTEGGMIILGIQIEHDGEIQVNGLSNDFHVNSIVHKAIDSLVPKPKIYYQYVQYRNKTLYAIKVEKSEEQVLFEGRTYVQSSELIIEANPKVEEYRKDGYERINIISQELESYKLEATGAKINVLEHYMSVLKLIDDLGKLLYPDDPMQPTKSAEGKVMARIIFSSFVDNFETYLSDLLYEIYLANPQTLKSKNTITIEEVLDCSDLQEFISYCAKQRIGKLQKGSVKGFVKENKQISELGVVNDEIQEEIEKILQIRHLYSHRNGIIDEKFLQFYPGQFALNTEHRMSINQICDMFCYLAGIIDQIDVAARKKYKLA